MPEQQYDPDAPQLQERIDTLREARGHTEETPITFERKKNQETGEVTVAFVFPEGGDRISGRGATTAEAVDQLEQRLEAWPQ